MGDGEQGVSDKENTSSVKQEDIANIMNAINDAITKIGYVAVGYDNTDTFLTVLIDKDNHD